MLAATFALALSGKLMAAETSGQSVCMDNPRHMEANQAELNRCAATYFQTQEAELNRLYVAKLAALRLEKNKSRLLEAQKAWQAFRNLSCVYSAGERDESPTRWPLDYNACMGDLTKQRIENFKYYLSCTETGCPE